MPFLWIVLAATGIAVVYGVLHDLVTAHVCVEYFTKAHPPVFGTEDPALLALGWGVIATWWAGALAGLVLGLAARAGARPPVPARAVARALAGAATVVGGFAALAGLGVGLATHGGLLRVAPAAEQLVEPARQARFMGVAAAHLASYAGLVVAVAVLGVLLLRQRRQVA